MTRRAGTPHGGFLPLDALVDRPAALVSVPRRRWSSCGAVASIAGSLPMPATAAPPSPAASAASSPTPSSRCSLSAAAAAVALAMTPPAPTGARPMSRPLFRFAAVGLQVRLSRWLFRGRFRGVARLHVLLHAGRRAGGFQPLAAACLRGCPRRQHTEPGLRSVGRHATLVLCWCRQYHRNEIRPKCRRKVRRGESRSSKESRYATPLVMAAWRRARPSHDWSPPGSGSFPEGFESALQRCRHALLSTRIPSPSPPCEAACLVQEGQPVPFTLPKAVFPNTHDRAVGQASSLRTFEPGASSSSKGGKNVFGQGGLGKETNYTK